MGQYHLVASKGVQEGDPNGETSVTPAWRQTVAHLVAGFSASTPPNALEWAGEAIAASIKVAQLRKITPNSGSYWNETDRYEPNWETSFWGEENFAKLKAIKDKYDPNRVFQVWNGVGGLRPETKSTEKFSTSFIPTLFLN